eukprot:19405-Heterococcus_DN1.PRE.1
MPCADFLLLSYVHTATAQGKALCACGASSVLLAYVGYVRRHELKALFERLAAAVGSKHNSADKAKPTVPSEPSTPVPEKLKNTDRCSVLAQIVYFVEAAMGAPPRPLEDNTKGPPGRWRGATATEMPTTTTSSRAQSKPIATNSYLNLLMYNASVSSTAAMTSTRGPARVETVQGISASVHPPVSNPSVNLTQGNIMSMIGTMAIAATSVTSHQRLITNGMTGAFIVPQDVLQGLLKLFTMGGQADALIDEANDVIELVNGSYDTSPSTNSRVASSGGAILEYTLPVLIWTLLLDSLHMLADACDFIEQLGNASNASAFNDGMNTDTYNEPIEYGYVNMPYYMGDMSGYHYNDNNVYEQQHSVVDYNLIDEILEGLENENLRKLLIGNGNFSNAYMTKAVAHLHSIATMQKLSPKQQANGPFILIQHNIIMSIGLNSVYLSLSPAYTLDGLLVEITHGTMIINTQDDDIKSHNDLLFKYSFTREFVTEGVDTLLTMIKKGCFYGFDLVYVHIGMNRLWNDVFTANGWPVQYDVTGQFVMATAVDSDDTYMQAIGAQKYRGDCVVYEPMHISAMAYKLPQESQLLYSSPINTTTSHTAAYTSIESISIAVLFGRSYAMYHAVDIVQYAVGLCINVEKTLLFSIDTAISQGYCTYVDDDCYIAVHEQTGTVTLTN